LNSIAFLLTTVIQRYLDIWLRALIS
jgi:hypothetical protein